MKCAVFNCKNSHHTKNMKIGFFTFPTNEKIRKQWVHFCRREVKSENARICSEHFLPEDFANQMQFEMGFAKFRVLKPDAIPTVTVESKPPSVVARNDRFIKRANKKIISELLAKAKVAEKDINVVNEVENMEDPLGAIDSVSLATTNKIVIADALVDANVASEEIEVQIEVENIEDPLGTATPTPSASTSQLTLIEKIKLLERHIDTLTRDNLLLREQKLMSDKEYKKLEKRVIKMELEQRNIEEKLRSFLTADQIEKLKGELKRRNCSEKDISHSTTPYSSIVTIEIERVST